MNYSGNWIDLRPALPYVTNYIAADRQGEIMDAIKRQDMQALQQEPGFWQKLALGADAYKGVKEAQDLIQAQQAAPYDFAAKRMLADPEFRGNAEALQDFQQRPEFWTETNKIAGNPNAATIMSTFANNAAQQELDTNMGNAIKQNQANPYAALDPYTLSQMYKRNDAVTNVGKIADLGGKADTNARNQAFANSLNAFVAGNPELAQDPNAWNRAVMVNYSRFKPDKDVVDTAFKGVDAMFPKMELREAGDAQGRDLLYNIDSRTGTATPVAGVYAQDPTRKANKQSISVTQMGDKKGVGDFIGKLPEYHSTALSASDSNKLIDQMQGLIKKGTGGGARNYAIATVAPALNMVGIDTKGMNDAQLYQALADNLGGKMRIDIVGPGPVSNYEQKLIKTVSGGGKMAPAAANELLNMYRSANNRKIQTFNSYLDAASTLAPETAAAYRRTGTPQVQGTGDIQSAAAAELARRRKK